MENLIETTRLTKRYDYRNAVDHVDLKVREGEVYGFLGPNGAGKTTTLRRQGTVAELLGRGALVVKADPLDRGRAIAETMLAPQQVSVVEGALRLDAEPGDAARINKELVMAGIAVRALGWADRTLEDAFFEITSTERKS